MLSNIRKAATPWGLGKSERLSEGNVVELPGTSTKIVKVTLLPIERGRYGSIEPTLLTS
jgi:hypothetical protein